MTQQMYIGPTIPGVVKEGAVFIGGLPKKLASAGEKVPAIKELMIPVEEATKAVQALKEQGSIENISYRKVLGCLGRGERDGF